MRNMTKLKLVFITWSIIAVAWILDISGWVFKALGYKELEDIALCLLLACLFVLLVLALLAVVLVLWSAARSLTKAWENYNGGD